MHFRSAFSLHFAKHIPKPSWKLLRVNFLRWFLSVSTRDRSSHFMSLTNCCDRSVTLQLWNLWSTDQSNCSQWRRGRWDRLPPTSFTQCSASIALVWWWNRPDALQRIANPSLSFHHSSSYSLHGLVLRSFLAPNSDECLLEKSHNHLFHNRFQLPSCIQESKSLPTGGGTNTLGLLPGDDEVHWITGQCSTSTIHHTRVSYPVLLESPSLARRDQSMCSVRSSDYSTGGP